MYVNGRGVPQNYAEAARWFRRAADQGHDMAQHNLGVIYDFAQGVPQNYAEAARWYRAAADQGNAGSQYNLGVLYAKGQGVPQDYVIAHMLLNLSAAQGYEGAANGRDIVAKNMPRRRGAHVSGPDDARRRFNHRRRG
jgi:TPR repeat protein